VGAGWDGAADLSARVFVSWDADNLFLGARILDDVLVQPSGEAHTGDGLEVMLASDEDAHAQAAGSLLISLYPGDFTGQPPVARVWRGEAVQLAPVRVAARPAAPGYLLEASIPWGLIGGVPDQREHLGLALNVTDADTPDQPDQVTLLSSVPAPSWPAITRMGTLVLEN
jgi:hypothetical protein